MFRFIALKYIYHIIDERISIDGYVELRIKKKSGRTKWIKRYKLVYKIYNGDLIKGMHIHHKDFNKLNDKPSNLIQITREKHACIHGKIYNSVGGSQRMKGKKHNRRTRRKIAKGLRGNRNAPLFRSENWKRKMSTTQKNLTNSNARKDISICDVKKLFENGFSRRKIARELGCSRTVVDHRLRFESKHQTNGGGS